MQHVRKEKTREMERKPEIKIASTLSRETHALPPLSALLDTVDVRVCSEVVPRGCLLSHLCTVLRHRGKCWESLAHLPRGDETGLSTNK